jgi:hypothetical protein
MTKQKTTGNILGKTIITVYFLGIFFLLAIVLSGYIISVMIGCIVSLIMPRPNDGTVTRYHPDHWDGE